MTVRSSGGTFSATLTDVDPGQDYEFRAVVEHPKITLRGRTMTLERAR
jgi:hypothetical protein